LPVFYHGQVLGYLIEQGLHRDSLGRFQIGAPTR
jgi:hypothetical protein